MNTERDYWKARAADAERQAKKMARMLNDACHSCICAIGEDCPFPYVRCQEVSAEHWLVWAARENDNE